MLETKVNVCFNLQDLMINEKIDTVAKLRTALIGAEDVFSAFPKDTSYQNVQQRSLVYLLFLLLYFLQMFPSMESFLTASINCCIP